MTTPTNIYRITLELTAVEVAQLGHALKDRDRALRASLNQHRADTLGEDLHKRLKATNSVAHKIETALGDPI